jgi:hypothetical protein
MVVDSCHTLGNTPCNQELFIVASSHINSVGGEARMRAKLTISSPGDVSLDTDRMAKSRSLMVKGEAMSGRTFTGSRSKGGSEGGTGQRSLDMKSATTDAISDSVGVCGSGGVDEILA